MINELINSYIEAARTKRAQSAPPAPPMTKQASAASPQPQDLTSRSEQMATLMDKIASASDEQVLTLLDVDYIKEGGKHKGDQGKAGKLKIQKEPGGGDVGNPGVQKEPDDGDVGSPRNQEKKAEKMRPPVIDRIDSPTPGFERAGARQANMNNMVAKSRATSAAQSTPTVSAPKSPSPEVVATRKVAEKMQPPRVDRVDDPSPGFTRFQRQQPSVQNMVAKGRAQAAAQSSPTVSSPKPPEPAAVAARKTAEEIDPGVLALAHLHQLKIANQELTEDTLAKIAAQTGLDSEDVLDLADEVFETVKTATPLAHPGTKTPRIAEDTPENRRGMLGKSYRQQVEQITHEDDRPLPPKTAGEDHFDPSSPQNLINDPAVTALAHLHQLKMAGEELTEVVVEKIAAASGLDADDIVTLGEQVFVSEESAPEGTEPNVND